MVKVQGARAKGQRVQVPAYTNAWLSGDRFGTVVRVKRSRKSRRGFGGHLTTTLVVVRLDKSGRESTFIDTDCTYVDCAD